MTIQQFPFFQLIRQGQETFTTVGSTSWVVPDEVFYINAVCIGGGASAARGQATREQAGAGGGGLRYIVNLPVVPGETLTVVVGAGGTAVATNNVNGNNGTASSIARGANILLQADGGTASTYVNGSNTGGAGGSGTTPGAGPFGGTVGGFNGGSGGNTSGNNNAGGGGAGGYLFAGGAGVNDAGTFNTTTNGSGDGGSGGEDDATTGFGGGGTGLLGSLEISVPSASLGGSGGTSGTQASGGLYGGGGGGAEGSTSGAGGQGAVRIMWGPADDGTPREYPNSVADNTLNTPV